MVATRIIHPYSPQDQALDFVLSHGQNEVIWDDCHFIWDSFDLINDATSPSTENVKQSPFSKEQKHYSC